MLGKVAVIAALEKCCFLVLLIRPCWKPVAEMLILRNDEFRDATSVMNVAEFFWPAQVKMAAEEHSSSRDHSSREA